MRRLAAIAALAVGLPLVLVFGAGAGSEEGGYRIRAIFDNAAAAVPGEDVKVAGARVGRIEDIEVTPDNRAAATLLIERAGFDRFKRDARCTVRPQSLIGEKFVECTVGSPGAPELARIPGGRPGAGDRLLPLENTSSPVDLDLVNDVLRRPYRERLALLVSQFGTGLAGRGDALNEAIHRANPALRETDEVLAILAGQNRVLADLARDADTALGPLARERAHVGRFVERANRTAEATAERRTDLARSVERLPRLLPELRATLEDLGAFSVEMTPVVRDLGAAAPDLNRFVLELGPFSREATPSLRSLGRAAGVGGPALDDSHALLEDLRDFGRELRPVTADLDALTESFDQTGGIERLMDYLFFQVAAINGFDGIGHYLRAGLIVNSCSVYATAPVAGCNANFTETRAVAAAAGGRIDPRIARTRDALGGGGGRGGRGRPLPPPNAFERLFAPEPPDVARQRRTVIDRIREGTPAPQAPAAEPLLDYLLGGSR
jgi:ABC-type transporter Mla subunit MlaD